MSSIKGFIKVSDLSSVVSDLATRLRAFGTLSDIYSALQRQQQQHSVRGSVIDDLDILTFIHWFCVVLFFRFFSDGLKDDASNARFGTFTTDHVVAQCQRAPRTDRRSHCSAFAHDRRHARRWRYHFSNWS